MARHLAEQDWPQAHEYEYLRDIDAASMAWEWLRRNRDYREDVRRWAAARGSPAHRSSEVAPAEIQRRWGCISLQMPEVRSIEATPLWSRAVDPTVLTVRALPAQADDATAFMPSRWAHLIKAATVPDGTEHLQICEGYRRIRMDVAEGSLLAGPVHLAYDLHGVSGIDGQVLTLRRLLALCRAGFFVKSLHAPLSSGPRLVRALRAHDATERGASIGDVGIALFGEARVRAEWNAPSEAMKSHCRRLIATARRMVTGGYLSLLRK